MLQTLLYTSKAVWKCSLYSLLKIMFDFHYRCEAILTSFYSFFFFFFFFIYFPLITKKVIAKPVDILLQLRQPYLYYKITKHFFSSKIFYKYLNEKTESKGNTWNELLSSRWKRFSSTVLFTSSFYFWRSSKVSVIIIISG